MTQLKPADPDNSVWTRTLFLATDSSHSIIDELVDGKTNAVGYSAYGEQSAQQDVMGKMGFNGQLCETNFRWYLLGNGYRAYNPRLMRFHSPDSWSPFRRGGLNAYMYCVGDPVNRSDPTGHISIGKFLTRVLDFFSLNPQTTGSNYGKAIEATQVAGGLAAANGSGEFRGLMDVGAGIGSLAPRPGGRSSTPLGNSPAIGGPGVPRKHHLGYARNAPNSSINQTKSVTGSGGKSRSNGSNKLHTIWEGAEYRPRYENNALQGGEVLPRKNHWPSDESIASNGSSWTNATNTTSGHSIHSDRFDRAAELRDLDEMLSRLNQLSRFSSNESFHSAASSIRSST